MDESMKVPKDLFYTNDHTWILQEGEEGTIGLTDFGQTELSEIVYIDLPDLGTEVVQGSPFGTIEAMKTVAELISPASGEVLEVNETLESDPRQVNIEPYGEGWMIKIGLHNPDEMDNLLTPREYFAFVTGEDIE